jgi:DNA topoisomerase-3
MEIQMKAICEGRTTRNDVVQQNLDQYRAVFNRTVQQINVLKSVSHDILRLLCVEKVD